MRKYLLLMFIVTTVLSANIRKVPADFATIQSGINASSNGDTVVVYPGTYFENVIFRGKKIVLTSRYYESKDVSFISSTIINGSTPAQPDSASCVLIINGEDSTTVLQGFTLTGGKGTKWLDEHGAGVYREGGGVLTALTSPVIRNNYIFNNEAVNSSGIRGAGGGGIRSGDGAPKIYQNVIMMNRAMYGAGIVLNYCDGAIVKNNIIYNNKVDNYSSGAPTFGGGGIWINDVLSAQSPANVIQNNTFFMNFSVDRGSSPAGAGAAILAWNGAKVIIRNNLMWENHFGSQLGPVAIIASTATIDYNSSMNAIGGTNTLIVEPKFADSSFYLSPSSTLIDAGDPATQYNDLENLSSLGNAKFPSRGALRNDLGAYGGPGAVQFPEFNRTLLFVPSTTFSFDVVFPGQTKTITAYYWSHGTIPLKIDSIRIRGGNTAAISYSHAAPKTYKLTEYDTIKITWSPSAPSILNDTIFIYHNDLTQANPAKIILTGKSYTITAAQNGVMYAFSGATDVAKMYTVDSANGSVSTQGSTGYQSVISARINPKTKEIIALATSTAGTKLIRVSSIGADNLPLSTITIANPKGMAFKSDGTLLIGAFNGSIYSVDINTGTATVVATTGGLRLSGLAYHPLTGILWASVRPTSTGKDNIYKINLANGTTTLVGSTGFGISTKDITFDHKGRLFGVIDTTGSQSYLISIDTSSGKGKLVGGMTTKGIEAIDLQSYFITKVSPSVTTSPLEFSLDQNYPNPFNPSTTIGFTVKTSGFTSLTVFDILGKQIATVVNEYLTAGKYTVNFNAEKLSSGLYFYSIRSGKFITTKKMTLMK